MTWIELSKPWNDTSVEYCDVCGNLLVRRYWEFASGGRTLRACRVDDEELLDMLERYRGSAPFPGPAAPGGVER